MAELATILFALAVLFVLHWLIHEGSRKTGRAIGRAAGSLLRAPFRLVLTKYYRRKIIRQRQEERRKRGVPPLENPDML
jgi:hypothetical protein